MLKITNSFEPATRFELIIRRIDAYDPESGAFLRASGGRTSKAPKWFLIFSDVEDSEGRLKPYKEWRHTFRAWEFREALDHANSKLAELTAKGKAIGRSDRLRI